MSIGYARRVLTYQPNFSKQKVKNSCKNLNTQNFYLTRTSKGYVRHPMRSEMISIDKMSTENTVMCYC